MKIVGTLEYVKTDPVGVGRGQNSEVWIADELQLGGKVAVKEIPQSSLGNTPDDFFAEARSMFAADHENVVPIRYACLSGGKVNLVMPYYRRGSLLDRIEERPLSLLEVRRIGQGILAGLGRIHSAGSIHFDLKPSNILFSNNDSPLVADFGQARKFDPATGVVRVPPLYEDAMPPEALKRGVGMVQSDIFQIGLLLYRAANGEPFYKSQVPTVNLDDKILRGIFPNRQEFLPHIPDRMRRVIRKALQVDPAKRYASAAEMSTALGRCNIQLDWKVDVSSDNMEWRAERGSRPAIIFRMIERASVYDVEMYTESNAGPRARGKAAWRSGLRRSDAFQYIEEQINEL